MFTLKSGVKMTICCALIISQRYCSDEACKKLRPMLAKKVASVAEFSTPFALFNKFLVEALENCLGTGFTNSSGSFSRGRKSSENQYRSSPNTIYTLSPVPFAEIYRGFSKTSSILSEVFVKEATCQL